jgi:hypothetical protein
VLKELRELKELSGRKELSDLKEHKEPKGVMVTPVLKVREVHRVPKVL